MLRRYPEGFPSEDSTEFRQIAYDIACEVFDVLKQGADITVSTIERYEIVRIARKVLKDVFAGNGWILPVDETTERYFFDSFGYTPNDASAREGFYVMIDLIRRVHARQHHESEELPSDVPTMD